jgi:hypothetical protein
VNPASVCDTIVTPAPAGTFPIVAAWPPGPLGAVPVDNCVNAAADVTVRPARRRRWPQAVIRMSGFNANIHAQPERR